jgi:hypothetical protein
MLAWIYDINTTTKYGDRDSVCLDAASVRCRIYPQASPLTIEILLAKSSAMPWAICSP